MAALSIPAALKGKDRWLLCKNDGRKKEKVRIYNPTDMQPLNSTDEAAMSPFTKAVEAMNKDTSYSLVYVLDKQEYVITILDAINTKTKKPYGLGRNLLRRINSYSEYNDVDNSIRILFTLNDTVTDSNFDIHNEAVAVKQSGDYVLLSGVPYSSHSKLKDCSSEIDDILSLFTDENDLSDEDEFYVTLSQDKTITNIPIENLVEFGVVKQPFAPYDDAMLEQMTKSVKTRGIITPIIVRPHPNQDGKYEIVSGHNRVRAAKEAELVVVPAVIEEMDDETAILVLVDTNLKQRHGLSFSEKAFAFKLKNDVYKRQGKRNDLYGYDDDNQLVDARVHKLKGKTSDVIGSNENRSGRTVRRYIRLTRLINVFLSDLDAGDISFRAAEPISFLSEEEQENLHKLVNEMDISITLDQAKALKKAKENKETLTNEKIKELLDYWKSKSPRLMKHIKLPYESIAHFFEGEDLNDNDINNKIIEALEYYKQSKQ
jgi:ParB family chromosome partitioning protein